MSSPNTSGFKGLSPWAPQADLLNALDDPPSERDFPSIVGYSDARGRMCVHTEISRRLGINNEFHFRDIMRVTEGKQALLRLHLITCTSNPELSHQTWDDFCKQEGECTERGYGCRSHADFRRLDDHLTNGFGRSDRRVARWGTEVIWQAEGNHRVAAMAHFAKREPEATYAIDVVMHDYIPNPDHPLAGLSFGLVRERKKAEPDLFRIVRDHAELNDAVGVHALTEWMRMSVEEPDPRFADTYLVVFKKNTPLSMLMQRTLRENFLFWDLRRYFGLP